MYSNKIKSIRERNGITQRELAKMLNIAFSKYCDYENEKNIIPLEYLNTLCNYLKLSLDYIFKFNDKQNYKYNNQKINKKLFSNRLKELRKENNLTQEKLAKVLNIAIGAISGYENDKYFIKTHALYQICKKYNMSADYLLGKIDYIPDWCIKKDE